MIRVIIVDDEPAARRTLRECCAQQADFELIGEYGDTRGALEAIRATPPDLLFLDIQLDATSGMELARALDPAKLPMIVFVTAYDQYALEAFELSATDYLLKPFDEERFAKTLARVRHRWDTEGAAEREGALHSVLTRLGVRAANDARTRLLAEIGSRLCMLDVSSVEIAEADRNYVKLTVGRQSYHARSTLQQAEKALESQPMLKISRSCLVNVNYVHEVSRTPRGDFILVLAGGTTVTSSEGFRDPVRQYFERLKMAQV